MLAAVRMFKAKADILHINDFEVGVFIVTRVSYGKTDMAKLKQDILTQPFV